jgi:hypothetical protein
MVKIVGGDDQVSIYLWRARKLHNRLKCKSKMKTTKE